MNRKRLALLWLGSALGLLASSGASCPHLVDQYTRAEVRALRPSPTLDEVIALVNSNSDQIQSIYTTDATISGDTFPTLKARLALERPRRFRLLATKLSLLGPEVDIGSNDELFWVWVQRNDPPAVYYCRHDELAQSPARQTFPIEPAWLIDALGLARFDPQDVHRGPLMVAPDRLEVHSTHHGNEGPITTVTTVDAQQGWVVELKVYDRGGGLLAKAAASDHRRDPLSGIVLPYQVDLQWPSAGLAMRINLGEVELNQMEARNNDLWTMPEYPGSQMVNLGDPRVRLPQPNFGNGMPGQTPQVPSLDEAGRARIAHRPIVDWLGQMLRR